MSAITGALLAAFIALLLAAAAASALAIRELLMRTDLLFDDVERLQDDAIRSGPNLGEVEALREQLAELTKMRREVCEAIGVNSNVATPEQVVFCVREFVKTSKAVSEAASEKTISNYEIEALRAEVDAHEAFRKEVCAALHCGPRASYEGLLAHIRRQHDAFVTNVDQQLGIRPSKSEVDGEEFSPVPPPRVKKPRKPRQPKTTTEPVSEPAQVSLETALAEAAEQKAIDDSNEVVGAPNEVVGASEVAS